jgi:nitrogen PTS system EIIA component
MRIKDFLTPEHSRAAVPGVSKKRVLEYLSNFLGTGNAGESAANHIYQKLIERERLGSTGIGCGVAIPHCRVAGCKEMTGALLSLQDQIDFDAIDGEPVDLIFALIVPEEHNQKHLDALAAIANLMQDAEVRDKLRAAANHRDLYELAIAQEH